MTTHPIPTIRKFNPGLLQSDEEIREQFVVRHHELGLLLDDLRGNIGSPSCQHMLVVGPRGRGKTMLLARVAAELRGNEEFAGSLLPVRFMEESQEIFSLTDFWLETMFHLANEVDEHDAGWPGSCATPGTRWRRVGGSRSPRRTPAPPYWMPPTDWASSSSSSSRTCSHSSVTSTTISAGNSAKSFRRNRRSSCWAPPPAASANWTM